MIDRTERSLQLPHLIPTLFAAPFTAPHSPALNLLYSHLLCAVTGGQFVAPEKLSKAGFVFADTDLKDTISRILK